MPNARLRANFSNFAKQFKKKKEKKKRGCSVCIPGVWSVTLGKAARPGGSSWRRRAAFASRRAVLRCEPPPAGSDGCPCRLTPGTRATAYTPALSDGPGRGGSGRSTTGSSLQSWQPARHSRVWMRCACCGIGRGWRRSRGLEEGDGGRR